MKYSHICSVLIMCMVTGIMRAADDPIRKLGRNGFARFGAWLTTCATVAGVARIADWCLRDSVLQKLSVKLPLSDEHREWTANVASKAIVFPLVAFLSIRYSALLWYLSYIFYANERISPLLARNILQELRLYVQHLTIIKAVQKDLNKVIHELNQSTGDPLRVLSRVPLISPTVLVEFQTLIAEQERAVIETLSALQTYISPSDSEMQAVAVMIKDLEKPLQFTRIGISSANLQHYANEMVLQVQHSGQDFGYDAQVLNNLIRDLIDYWQKYTTGLAESIDFGLRRCNIVYAMEQFITTFLNRPLSLV